MSDRREALKRVIVDLNTQADFLLPNGAFPVSNRATMGVLETTKLIGFFDVHEKLDEAIAAVKAG